MTLDSKLTNCNRVIGHMFHYFFGTKHKLLRFSEANYETGETVKRGKDFLASFNWSDVKRKFGEDGQVGGKKGDPEDNMGSFCLS